VVRVHSDERRGEIVLLLRCRALVGWREVVVVRLLAWLPAAFVPGARRETEKGKEGGVVGGEAEVRRGGRAAAVSSGLGGGSGHGVVRRGAGGAAALLLTVLVCSAGAEQSTATVASSSDLGSGVRGERGSGGVNWRREPGGGGP
jgi:hypothetical protein